MDEYLHPIVFRGPLLLAWFDFNLNMDKQSHSHYSVCTIDVGEWINNFIPHTTMDVIIYSCWN